MWLFHPLGFASIVVDALSPNHLLCRARVKKDLANLFPEHAKFIKRTPRSDYLFRVSVPRALVAARLTELVETIDYGNFKDACPKDRHDPYLKVWWAMYEIQTPKQKLTLPFYGFVYHP